MTDAALLTAVEPALPGLTPFDRAVYAHARLRLLRGESLKPAQRVHLQRLLERLQPPPPARLLRCGTCRTMNPPHYSRCKACRAGLRGAQCQGRQAGNALEGA